MWNVTRITSLIVWLFCSLWTVKAPWQQGGSLQLHLWYSDDFSILLPITESHPWYTQRNNTSHNKMVTINKQKIYWLWLISEVCVWSRITFSVTSEMEKWKSDLSCGKNSRKVFTADIFIYESLEVLRGSKNVGWIYLLNKGQQNTTTNIRRKHSRSKIFQSGEMWKCSQRRIAPADDKCQNNSDKERKEKNMSEQKEQQLFM